MRRTRGLTAALIYAVCLPLCLVGAQAQTVAGDEPVLGPPELRIQQSGLASGALSLWQIRRAGLHVFSARFRKSDGFGDGPVALGGRPLLQNNGTFLRINGLDAQSCLGCHDEISAAVTPVIKGVGGSAGIANSAMPMTRAIDVADFTGNGFAGFDGRLINPPALFGTGGVQLVAKEMTTVLQQQKQQALQTPGTEVRLRANGVDFGHIVADAQGNLDTSGVEGIDADLVVRPFGRKGEFASVRAFDVNALMFHMGLQPVEMVGADVDADNDGVSNEVTIGEVSALEIFVTTQERPRWTPLNSYAVSGARRFQQIGCADCHRPTMVTRSPYLTYSYPEVETDPSQNVFYSVDLRQQPAGFQQFGRGIVVPMFSDLKRHDMGPELAESLFSATDQQNREFITVRLWGVADTAPYLHDGRAFTLNEAILLHGGEAQTARDRYAALSVAGRNDVLAFLATLRNPESPNADVLNSP
ncbi:MAG: di-heme oxidoredictase family protein [Gammaproteobacteria bacterium]|nr:di-heme oxidoredictase family protein [Gammaproteobacteria bacterium]